MSNLIIDVGDGTILITNGLHLDEKVYIQYKDEHIISVDICRGNNPTRITRVDAKLSYQEFVSENGGTLRWPMR